MKIIGRKLACINYPQEAGVTKVPRYAAIWVDINGKYVPIVPYVAYGIAEIWNRTPFPTAGACKILRKDN